MDECWKNIGCLDKYEVVQGSCVSYDRLHLQAELPVRVAIPFNVFQCVFQFVAVALRPQRPRGTNLNQEQPEPLRVRQEAQS